MKRSLVLFSTIALFAATGAFAQESSKKIKVKTTTTTTKTVAPAIEGAGMIFQSEVMDYGDIPHNSDGKREFVFTNNGNKPLIITNAQGSCGCTVPVYPKEPIAPGAKAVISVKYDTTRIGAFKKTVTITSNATEPTKTLTIQGTVLGTTPAKETPKS